MDVKIAPVVPDPPPPPTEFEVSFKMTVRELRELRALVGSGSNLKVTGKWTGELYRTLHAHLNSLGIPEDYDFHFEFPDLTKVGE